MTLTLQAILPLNSLEIMTMVNFKHLDEEKLLESGKVLKQKSGYTHAFDPKLGAILKEDGITPLPELEAAYGSYYCNVLEYNAGLAEPVFVEQEESAGFVAGVTLLAPWLWKQYSPLGGWEEPLVELRRSFVENWDAQTLQDEVDSCRKLVEERLTTTQVISATGFRGCLERWGWVKPTATTVRYPVFERLQPALDGFIARQEFYQNLDQRIRDFAVKFSPIISTLVQRFQELGVDCRNPDSPNYDYLQFHNRYIGPLKVKFED